MDKKKKFLQMPTLAVFTIILFCFSLPTLIGLNILVFQKKGEDIIVAQIIMMFFSLLLLTFLIALTIYSFNIVIIDKEKIVVKGLFRTLNKCRIDSITDVYHKEFFRVGVYFILIDDRKPKHKIDFIRKDSYIGFQCTNKSERILNEFWHGDIGVLDWRDDNSF
jgi:hypothetical protein